MGTRKCFDLLFDLHKDIFVIKHQRRKVPQRKEEGERGWRRERDRDSNIILVLSCIACLTEIVIAFITPVSCCSCSFTISTIVLHKRKQLFNLQTQIENEIEYKMHIYPNNLNK
jgi:hypothetical protein